MKTKTSLQKRKKEKTTKQTNFIYIDMYNKNYFDKSTQEKRTANTKHTWNQMTTVCVHGSTDIQTTNHANAVVSKSGFITNI